MDDINDPNSGSRLPRNGKLDDPRMIGAWKIGRTIGKGSSGRVKIARHSKTGQYAAVKIISKTSLLNSRISLHDLDQETDRILLNIEREIVIMKLIDHPNVMHLYDVWETSGELYLILEYVEGGELFDYLCEKGRLPASEALDYFQQIIGAIDYCHRFNVAHRDLKPENLLMDKQRNIKIADFGMAAWQAPGIGNALETSCGSPHYAAPEVVMGKPYNGFMSDIWSCGVILFALLAGRLPFDDENITVLLDKVKLGKFVMPTDIDASAKDLLGKMLEKNVKKRITMEDILAHPWFNSQPPRHPHCTPATLEEIARPVASASQIDSDIFKNLKTIWHDIRDEDIISNLLSEKRTWEKGLYHLLMKYRTTHLENYAEKDQQRIKKRSKKRHMKNTPVVQQVSQVTIRNKEETTPSSPVTRPDPPTPRRAANRNRSPSMEGSQNDSFQISVPIGNSAQSHLLAPPPSPMGSSSNHSSDIVQALEPLSLPTLDAPGLQDENIQKFFRQIVEHLNAMQAQSSARSSNPDTSSPYSNTYSNTTVSDQQAVQYYVPAKVSTTPSRDSLLRDYLAINSVQRNDQVGRNSSTRKRNKILLGGVGLPNILGGRNMQPTRPILANRPRTSDEKENGAPGNVQSSTVPKGSKIAKKSSLRRNDGARRDVLVDKKVQIVLPQEDHSDRPSPGYWSHGSPDTAISDDSLSASHSIPKRSWFNNLFKFKPIGSQILSAYDIITTRDQCKTLLANFGVSVILVNAERFGYLKCKFDEIRDPVGIMTVTKAVQFRVEVHPATESQFEAGFLASVLLTQEKGANSTFKLICERLERDWEMTAPRIQIDLPEQTSSRFAELIYPVGEQ